MEDEDEEEDEDEVMPEAGPSILKPKATAEEKIEEAEGNDAQELGEEEETAEAEEEEEEQPPQPDPATFPPPRILITTSPSPSKGMYQFCDDLKNIFPGGEFFKRPKGRGFELGRVARWAGKRGFGACLVVNEDHKIPSPCFLLDTLETLMFRCYHFDETPCGTNGIFQAD